MRIGRIEIDPVLDGSILAKLHASKPFPEPGSPQWDDQHGIFRDDGLIESTLGAFLVRTADRVVLVDAGGGPALPDPYAPLAVDVDDPDDPIASMFRARGLPDEAIRELALDLRRAHIEQGRLPASLDALGVRAEDVTDLVFTHLHFDHIGWASARGAAHFPNATIRCASADLEYFLTRPDEEQFVTLLFHALPAAERLAPVLDRIETWDSDGTIAPGVDVRLAPGHTPGSSVIVLSDGGEQAMLLGDIVHCPLELMDDDFNLLADHDQELANKVREAYARELERGAIPAAAAHFPGLQFGRLLPSDGRTRRWTFTP
jgi:glyoxylase-like metal-dependent hydrolase (beta-lactamase superfamily II)